MAVTICAGAKGFATRTLFGTPLGTRPSDQIADAFLARSCIKRVVQIFGFLTIGIVENDPSNVVGARAPASNEDGTKNPRG
jgi:hypothetical protein